jgi:hypothetical protein
MQANYLQVKDLDIVAELRAFAEAGIPKHLQEHCVYERAAKYIEELRNVLKDIEEYGTGEINDAFNLRRELVELKMEYEVVKDQLEICQSWFSI